MKLRHQDYYEWYIQSCNRCKTCIVGEEGDGDICPSVDLYKMFNFSGGGKSHIALAAIENRIRNWEDIEKSLYSCTFCGACYAACPVTIDLYNLIIDLREVLYDKGRTPPKLKKLGENLLSKDNPYGRKKKFIPPEGVKIYPSEKGKTLFFTGCQARMYEEASSSAKAALEILLEAGTDVMIMKDEPCCGSPVLEAGDYKSFTKNARKVIKEILSTGAEEMVIHCPHGYSTFLLSYELPDNFPEIYLFADYVKKLLDEGKLRFKNPEIRYTFQDPCRISHYMDESDTYYELFEKIDGKSLVKNTLSGKKSYCCGNPFLTPYTDRKLYEFTREKRLNQLSESAEIIVTACPGCQFSLKEGGAEVIDLPVLLKNLIQGG